MKFKNLLLALVFSPLIGTYAQVRTSSSTTTTETTTEVVEEEEVYEEEIETFGGTRAVSGHTVETLGKGVLEFRIEHRFGDLGGAMQTLLGLDNATDIRFGFEYGITDKLMVGVGRSRGTYSLGNMGSPYSALLDGFTKYRLLHQSKTMPLSAALIGTMSYTYMKANADVESVSHFPKQADRFAYSAQLNLARKFGSKISVAVMPTMVYRNYVDYRDVNMMFAIGGAVRYAFSTKAGLILEYYYNNLQTTNLAVKRQNSVGIAVEWMTFGHNFSVTLTNSPGFGETQFIPYTFKDQNPFAKYSQYRLGFCIGRKYMRE